MGVSADGTWRRPSHSAWKEREGGNTMNKTRICTGALAIMIGAVVAGSAFAATQKTTLTIRHQTRGCHTWSFNGGAYKASLKITVARGTTLKVVDNDVMPHKLVQLAGPKATLITPAMNHMSAQAKIVFAKSGTYRFTTKAGEDYSYMSGMKTIGEDNVLRLSVVVS
jgi:plastocyanin